MRSLEKCKAEVFRRSEERIKNNKKKKINRTVIAGLSTAAAVVLVVCAIKFVDVFSLKTKETLYDSGDSGNSAMNNAGGGESEKEDFMMGNLTEVELDFEVQYIKGSQWGDAEYPCVTVVKSVAELKQYLENDADINLEEACSKYDSEYFSNQVLVVYRISESSGSTRHNIKTLTSKPVVEGDVVESKLIIDFERLRADVGTCDMAEWYILIEPEAGFDFDEEDIEMELGGV